MPAVFSVPAIRWDSGSNPARATKIYLHRTPRDTSLLETFRVPLKKLCATRTCCKDECHRKCFQVQFLHQTANAVCSARGHGMVVRGARDGSMSGIDAPGSAASFPSLSSNP